MISVLNTETGEETLHPCYELGAFLMEYMMIHEANLLLGWSPVSASDGT